MTCNKQKINKPPPQELTHYTDIQGFMEIVKSQEMWASEATFLNDRQEIEHGLEGAKAILKRVTETEDIAQKIITDNELSISPEEVTKSAKKLLIQIENGQIPSIYVACFSENNDSLSQWRAYGKRQGIAITIDTRELDMKNRLLPGRLISVAYCDKVDDMFFQDPLLKKLGGYALLHALGDPRVDEEKDLTNTLYSLIAKFKHSGFEEEAEWRFVSLQEDGLKFRAAGNRLIPYVSLKNGEQHFPISKITIGPGHEQDLTMKSIEKFLKHYRFMDHLDKGQEVPSKENEHVYKDVSVIKSTIPYRAF